MSIVTKLHAARGSLRAACMTGPGLLLALLAPKCPLCAAAWLSALGLGAQLAPWLRPMMLTAAGLVITAALLRAARSSKRPRPGLPRPCCRVPHRDGLV